MKLLLTWLVNYRESWKERPAEMALWLAAIISVLAVGLSDPWWWE